MKFGALTVGTGYRYLPTLTFEFHKTCKSGYLSADFYLFVFLFSYCWWINWNSLHFWKLKWLSNGYWKAPRAYKCSFQSWEEVCSPLLKTWVKIKNHINTVRVPTLLTYEFKTWINGTVSRKLSPMLLYIVGKLSL